MNKTKEKIFKKIWFYLDKYKELRFLQFLFNAIRLEYGDIDTYYLDDERLLIALEKFEENLKRVKEKETQIFSFTPKNKIILNMARCLKCGETLVSSNVHDFKVCKCGNLVIDGGKEYLKRCVKDLNLYEDLSIVESEEKENK